MSKRKDHWHPGTPIETEDGAPVVGTSMGFLDNPGAQRVNRVAALASRRARTKHGRFLVEGPQSVREAVIHQPARVQDLYLTQAALERHSDVLAAAQDAGVYVHLVTDQVMAAMSTDAQGVLAVVATAAGTDAPTGVEALTAVLERGARIVAVLTETQDPGNAGTIIRAADAAGADAVVLARGSVDPTNPKVVRSTAGSLFHLPVVSDLTLDEAVTALKAAGLSVLAADGAGETGLYSPAADELLAAPSAWLLGNEARGFAPATLGAADAVVSIPVYGEAESLNVATAAAICLYASARAHHAGE